mgnify:CR=1 FL=1
MTHAFWEFEIRTLHIASNAFNNTNVLLNTIQCVSRDTDRLACLKSALHHFSNISAPLSRHTDSGAKSKTKLNSEATRKQLLDITEELSTKLEEAKLDQEQEEAENVCICIGY